MKKFRLILSFVLALSLMVTSSAFVFAAYDDTARAQPQLCDPYTDPEAVIAVEFVSKIDFEFYLSYPGLGEDIISDLTNIHNYITSHKYYTISDLNKLIEPVKKSNERNPRTRYDYSTLLPSSKIDLNDEETEVFNSNPIFGLFVLLQAAYANDQELCRFGSNTLGTNGDAFRHALWNALGTYYSSESYMQSFATAHETGSAYYNPNSVETQMDLYNNSMGRTLVSYMNLPSDPPNGMTIPYLMGNYIASATAYGLLVRFVVGGVTYSTYRPTNSATTN